MYRYKSGFRLRVIGLGLLLLFVLQWPPTVAAHGGGTPQLVNVVAGPYQLWVWSLPEPVRLGDMHISIAIAQPAPATELDVQIALTPLAAASQSIVQKALKQTRLFDESYEADFMLPAIGQWNASITVNSTAGTATTQFPFTVLPPHQLNWALILWSALAFAGLIGVIWIRRTASSNG